MMLVEQCDEWLVGRRYLSQESLAACFAASAATLTDSDQTNTEEKTALTLSA